MMQDRLLKTMVGTFVAAKWSGVDASGIEPLGDNVVILPDKPADKTEKGIYISEQQKERTLFAAESGVLISLGDDAFRWSADRQRAFEGKRPQPGDRVVFKRYSGITRMGNDGENYWIMTDSCIGAVCHDDVPTKA